MSTRIDIDTNRNGNIDVNEWTRAVEEKDPMEQYELQIGNQTFEGDLSQIISQLNSRNLFARTAGENWSPEDIFKSALDAKAQDTISQMDSLKAEIAKARQQNDQVNVEKFQQQLKQQILMMQRYNSATGSKVDLSSYQQAAELMESESNFSMKAQTFSGEEAQTSSRAQTLGGGAAATGFSPPAGWGAQTFGAQLDPSAAYTQMLAMEDTVMNSWDEINRNSQQGRKLMMLFFYFAKMAESGDMGAIYQFMKFITYIISKDKAKQQIEMGKKLIELQDLSRQWTNKLLNLQTNASDPNSSNELMKTMTIVKSETDAIATSQKLIGQMMEEFAQVVETLTNVTKSALEANGRILRTVAQMR